MASEAISSSIMIIGAALGAAVLIAAILPAIFSAGDTFGSVAYSAEEKLKTDFRIVNTYALDNSPDIVKVWMKNVGGVRISVYDVQKSDIFYSRNTTTIQDLAYGTGFTYSFPSSDNGYWDVGETIEIDITNPTISSGDVIYYSFTLPNSVRRTTTFSTNN